MQVSKNEILKHISSDNLCEDLTFSGLEVEEDYPAAGNFSGVVVGEITAIDQHPDAERLKVCSVNVGQQTIQVVTNLQTVFKGLRLPVALVGAKLADGMEITATKLRGVESNGMFCSCESLGMTDSSLEILSFSSDTSPGVDLRNALDLDDTIIDIAITPNRGDCLSYLGITRQLAAYTEQKFNQAERPVVAVGLDKTVAIEIDNTVAPVFAVRRIDNLKTEVATPLPMVELLRRSGVRSINLVVDCLNTVMLECGAPMHAYATDKISGNLTVGYATAGTSIKLLNDTVVKLDCEDIVVADANGPQALAGLMGGLDSAVSATSSSVILEAAYFDPELISKAVRRHKFSSDSAYRFERGVDWQLCEFALDRAAELICSIAGGEVGPISINKSDALQLKQIELRYAQVERLLGQLIAPDKIHNILQSLGCIIDSRDEDKCSVTAPSFRSDLQQECDLIEEILIISGVNNLPAAELKGNLRVNAGVCAATCTKWQSLYTQFAAMGFNEAVTYSFIAASDYTDFADIDTALELENPISQQLAVLRPSLLPGLLRALEFNINHQQERLQLFELGQCFAKEGAHEELAGLLYGSSFAASWSAKPDDFDIYACKRYVSEALQSCGFDKLESASIPAADPQSSAWHPGRSFDLFAGQDKVARIGQLHPALEAKYGTKKPVVMFTIALDALKNESMHKFQPFSDQPAISRDMSLTVKRTLESRCLTKKILEISGDLLENIHVFDVYYGQGVESESKSVGLNLTFRAHDRTLVEEEINNIMQQILEALESEFGAKLRM